MKIGVCQEGEAKNKFQVALLSLASNLFLTAVKVVAGLLTGSVSVFSEAVHSGTDLAASLIATVAVRKSGSPPDKTHLFGHGKFENLSGVLEAALIIGAAGYIIWESVNRLRHGHEIHLPEVAVGVMGLSVVLNSLVSKKLEATARRTDSIALEADALHLKTDVWTSLGVLLVLAFIYVSGHLNLEPKLQEKLQLLDPIVALIVALVVIKASLELLHRSLAGLLDWTLPEEEVAVIKEVLAAHGAGFLEFHDLRHRKSGPERHIDLHLVVYADLPVGRVHELCDSIENEIETRLPRSKVLIHVEPCTREDCLRCKFRAGCRKEERDTSP